MVNLETITGVGTSARSQAKVRHATRTLLRDGALDIGKLLSLLTMATLLLPTQAETAVRGCWLLSSIFTFFWKQQVFITSSTVALLRMLVANTLTVAFDS